MCLTNFMDLIEQEELDDKQKTRLKEIQRTLTARRKELQRDIKKLDEGLDKLEARLKRKSKSKPKRK
jgi:polyhydroxyalkanoate synthesis regulator phasin